MNRSRTPSLPGRRFQALAERLLDGHTVRSVIEPAIADLQHEAQMAGDARVRRFVALCRAYDGCARAVLLGLISRRSTMRMRIWIRTWMAAVGVCGLFAAFLVGMHLPVPTFVFTVICLVCVLPIAVAAIAIGARWDVGRATRLTGTAVPAGFLTGGLIGWMTVPSVWTASLWVTIDASMNAAKYGAAFEHTAEHALLYFLYPGILGALIAAVASIVATRVGARHPRPSGIR